MSHQSGFHVIINNTTALLHNDLSFASHTHNICAMTYQGRRFLNLVKANLVTRITFFNWTHAVLIMPTVCQAVLITHIAQNELNQSRPICVRDVCVQGAKTLLFGTDRSAGSHSCTVWFVKVVKTFLVPIRASSADMWQFGYVRFDSWQPIYSFVQGTIEKCVTVDSCYTNTS